MTDPFSPQSALQARDHGRLREWIQEVLRAPRGNVGLADGLNLAPRSYWGPFLMPLDLVVRCCGPEPGMAYPVPAEGFEVRVTGIQTLLSQGRHLPPLLVNYDKGVLTLNDGNHRHEAHRRLGAAVVPVIFWTTGEGPMVEFRQRYSEVLREITGAR